MENTERLSAKNVDNDINIERLQNQVKSLQQIGELLGVHWEKFTAGKVAASGQGFLSASNVAGSNLHHVVYGVGKFIGVDFKPWQAVGIAKDFANFAMFLAPIIAVAGAVTDIHAMQKEAERQDKMAEARREITSHFISVAKSLENQIDSIFRDVDLQIYGEIDKQIAAARQHEENAIAVSNTWVRQLTQVRQDFDSILRYITQVTENQVS